MCAEGGNRPACARRQGDYGPCSKYVLSFNMLALITSACVQIRLVPQPCELHGIYTHRWQSPLTACRRGTSSKSSKSSYKSGKRTLNWYLHLKPAPLECDSRECHCMHRNAGRSITWPAAAAPLPASEPSHRSVPRAMQSSRTHAHTLRATSQQFQAFARRFLPVWQDGCGAFTVVGHPELDALAAERSPVRRGRFVRVRQPQGACTVAALAARAALSHC